MSRSVRSFLGAHLAWTPFACSIASNAKYYLQPAKRIDTSMSSVFNWCEDNGNLTSGHGTTRSQNSNPPTDNSWKNVDDAKTGSGGTAYSSSPIVAGNNSFTKYQYGQFSGTYNQILNGLWSAHTAPSGSLDTGITLKGTVSSTYATPTTTTNSALTTDFTTAVAIGSGLTVEFSATDPSAGSPATTLASGGGFTQYLATQLQTMISAAPGDLSGAITLTLQYSEN
jgi:hypothetical protein